VLESFERGTILNRITVPDEIAAPARIALERMLSHGPTASTAATR
jgi:quinolinate synthase